MNVEELRRWDDGRQRLVDRLFGALRKVKKWVDDEGWCPICDEHQCRRGNCVLADLNLDDLDEVKEGK